MWKSRASRGRWVATVPLQLVLLVLLLVLLQEARPAMTQSTTQASYYTEYTPSACYGDNTGPLVQPFAAAGDGSPNIWQGGAACGEFYEITCEGNGCTGGGTINVKIVDHCPNGCEGRGFDLSEQAFSSIANTDVGVITVKYSSGLASSDI